jgi:NCS2 family nucleobase:cation symporter-2
LIPLAVPTFYHHFPSWAQLILHSGITVGSLLAVLLNFCFNEMGKKTEIAQQGQAKNS